jgi:hypothetical protein
MQKRQPIVRFPGKLWGVIKATSDRSCHTCEDKYRAFAGFRATPGSLLPENAVFPEEGRYHPPACNVGQTLAPGTND